MDDLPFVRVAQGSQHLTHIIERLAERNHSLFHAGAQGDAFDVLHDHN